MWKALRNSIIIVVCGFIALIVLLSAPQLPKSTPPQYFNSGPTYIPAPPPTEFLLSDYKPINNAELVSYAQDHIGEHVWTDVTVFNIIDDDTIQGYLQNSTDAIVVRFAGAHKKLYKNNEVIVYGVIIGYATGTNSFGASIKQPELDDARLN